MQNDRCWLTHLPSQTNRNVLNCVKSDVQIRTRQINNNCKNYATRGIAALVSIYVNMWPMWNDVSSRHSTLCSMVVAFVVVIIQLFCMYSIYRFYCPIEKKKKITKKKRKTELFVCRLNKFIIIVYSSLLLLLIGWPILLLHRTSHSSSICYSFAYF